MNITFRPVTEQDLDFVFALPEIEAIKPFLGETRTWCKSVTQHCKMGINEQTGEFIMNLPQRDRMDMRQRYLLVRDDGVAVIEEPSAGAWSDYPIIYISSVLADQLDVLTLLLQEMFSKGGRFLDGDPMDIEIPLANIARFVIKKSKGE